MAKPTKRRQTTQEPESNWWRRLIAAVLTAGALAGAVTAILSLRPGHDIIDNATFTSANVRSPERLSDFVERAGISPLSKLSPTQHPVAPVLAQAVVPGASGTPTSPTESPTSPTETPTPSGSSSSASGSATASGPPATTSPSPTGTLAPDTIEIPPILGTLASERTQLIRDMINQHALNNYNLPELAPPDSERPTLTPIPFTVTTAVDAHGNPLPPAVAAEKLAARLDAGRSAPPKDKSGKRDPVGALVTVNMELEGFRGQSVLLFWRLFPADGTSPLPKGWWKTTVAYRLMPSTDHDSANLDMWVPLPKAKGPYTLDLILALESNGIRLASYETAAFR